ncbi:MAG: caspase family protein, partial [Lachnospiraceae bacterium]|nr:caspase family protein [Lachnospiraceae bacterium]
MKRNAFLVCCDEYRNFANISFCYADMALIQETLVNYCDYEYINIDYSNQYPGCDDTPNVIYKKIQKMIELSEDGDSLLFYFAGHGAKEEEKGYLLLADSKSSNYADTALNLGKINELLRNPRINGYLILDACHSGILARNAFNSSVIDIISDTGCITLASCSENEESHPYPEMEQGVFTYFLCEEIKKVSIETPVLIEQLKINVCDKVAEWAQKNYKRQTPTLNGQIVGNIAIAFRNQNDYVGLVGLNDEEKFISELEHLEEEFFNRCYCFNLELGSFDEDAVFENYTFAQELCRKIDGSKYKLIDGWHDALVKLQFFSTRINEKKNIGISPNEQREVLDHIGSFVESIPSEFGKITNSMQKQENNGQPSKQIIQNNISKVLLNYALKVDGIMYEAAEKSTDDILNVEPTALYTLVLKKWLADNSEIQIRRMMPNNNEWRAFGQYYVYLAYDKEETPWIVMINILKKYNYSNVLHAFNNLNEIRNYYSRFGKEYKYHQIVIISQGKVLLPHSFVRKQTGTFVRHLPELLPTEPDLLTQSAFFLQQSFY